MYQARSLSKDTYLAMPVTHLPIASYQYPHLNGLKAYRHLVPGYTLQHQAAMRTANTNHLLQAQRA